MPEAVPLSEVIARAIQSAQVDLHTALPGIVRSYDASTQTADIELALRSPIESLDEDTEDIREAFPILPSVPVAWPRSGGHFMHFPMVDGDTVLVVFSELDPGPWRATGDVSDPGYPGRHGLTGAVAIPGYGTRVATEASADGTNGRIGRSGGPFVEFRSSEIHAGGSDDLALAAGLSALGTAIQNAPTAANDGGATFKAGIVSALSSSAAWASRATTTLKGS